MATGADSQLDRIEDLTEKIEELEEKFEEIDDKTKAQMEQEQALRAAKEDLRKAGAHVGYANSNRHAEQAKNRIRGIEATLAL